jgi:hypothetical protein
LCNFLEGTGFWVLNFWFLDFCFGEEEGGAEERGEEEEIIIGGEGGTWFKGGGILIEGQVVGFGT